MKLSHTTKRTILVFSFLFAFAGCGGTTLCDQEGGCLKQCVNQADCSDNQTCLNEGTCACFAGQNGADCTDSSDCNADEACSANCRCSPNAGGNPEPTPTP